KPGMLVFNCSVLGKSPGNCKSLGNHFELCGGLDRFRQQSGGVLGGLPEGDLIVKARRTTVDGRSRWVNPVSCYALDSPKPAVNPERALVRPHIIMDDEPVAARVPESLFGRAGNNPSVLRFVHAALPGLLRRSRHAPGAVISGTENRCGSM